ncbi:MAG: vWA domain-containing protein, partial [Ardenticatenaceae bacterium]
TSSPTSTPTASITPTPTNTPTVTNTATPTNLMCGPMDVVFVLDETGSMRDLLGSVQIVTSGLINQINMLSGGNYQLGLVTFKDNVQVDVDLAPSADAAILARVADLTPFQGRGEPEPSAEALNTVINGLDAGGTRPQIGDFNGVWRPGAKKIIILVTDALPGGFDDAYEVGVDDLNAHEQASKAAAGTIAISAIELDADPTTQAIMSHYANETRGFHRQANDGQQVIEEMYTIINNCGFLGQKYTLYLPITMR